MKELVKEVKQKREFKELPDSLVERILLLNRKDVKKTREVLRKYFGVFMTNKLVKGRLDSKDVLKKHISSRDRDYSVLYKRIFGDEKTIIDLGAGVNGFSADLIGKRYVAIEATKVYVDLMNKFFEEKKVNGKAIWEDLFNLDKIVEIVKEEARKGETVVWMFNVIDALELEPNYSKKLIFSIIDKVDRIVLSWPTRSLQKKKRFEARRYWIINFISENFDVLDEFEINGERFVVFDNTNN